MSNYFATFLFLFLAAQCNHPYVIPDPVPGGNSGQNTDNGNTDIGEQNGEGDGSTYHYGLEADGNDEGTYSLILARGYNYETPDNSGAHAQDPFRHIRQSYDNELKKYVFDFILHIENDDDRGKTDVTDRQRNEIKTDSHSPDSLVAQYGETLKISWKFRLPEGMQTTSKFAHIHQLKGIDNKEGTADVALPGLTFTCRTLSSGKQQFQVLSTASKVESDGSTTYLARADLSEFLGEWVSVTETVLFADEGSYSVVITRIRDGKQLVKVDGAKLDLWRTGCTGMRPKWGLYRNFGEGRSLAYLLRDEVLKFADFDIIKIKDK